MATWDTDALATDIRDRAQSPSSLSTAPGYVTADLLRRATGELLASVVPMILKAKEEYLVVDKDTTMTVGTASYRLPTRAVAAKLRDVVRVDSDGKEHDLAKLTLEEVSRLDPTTSGTPESYYLKGNTLHLYPVPDAAETLRMRYFRRPNRLVQPTTGSSGSIGLVSSTNTTTISMQAAAPSGWGSSTYFDVLQASPPFDTLAEDLTGATIVGNVLTFASAVVPTTISTGDYVCVAGEAPVVQLPVEAFYVLAQRVAVKILSGLDRQAYDDALRELTRLEADFYGVVEERNEGEPDYIINRIWP